MTDVRFTKHAREKFEVLARHGVTVTEGEVEQAVREPDRVDRESRKPQIIFQRSRDEEYVLRIVCRKDGNMVTVITFYPGRKSQYEK